MKKLCLMAGILTFSAIGFAQQNVTTSIPASDTLIKSSASQGAKIAQLEAEIAGLKAAQVQMQKQLSEIQSVLPAAGKKKKLVVNRFGSKQVVWSKDDEIQ